MSAARRFKHGLEYALLRAALGVFSFLPPARASALGGAIFRGIGPHMGISKVARRNMAMCFPDWPAAKIESVLAGMWDNLGRVVAEYPHLENIARTRVTFKNPEAFAALKIAGKAVIFVSGHLGNWEVLPPAILCGAEVTMHSVYRAPNNPLVDALLVRYRGFGGRLKSFGKNRKGLAETLRALENGQSVGMLIDQKMNTGIEARFFGHPAMTSTAFVELARKLDLQVVPGRIVRLPDCRFEIEIEDALSVGQSPVETAVAEMHARLETWITEHPDQWLWLHRRWKKDDKKPA